VRSVIARVHSSMILSARTRHTLLEHALVRHGLTDSPLLPSTLMHW